MNYLQSGSLLLVSLVVIHCVLGCSFGNGMVLFVFHRVGKGTEVISDNKVPRDRRYVALVFDGLN